MKRLIVGFGLAGIYAAHALKKHQLEIISNDVDDASRVGCGKVDQWGGILYHYSNVEFYSSGISLVRKLGSRNIANISSTLKTEILENKGILFKARSRWFRNKVIDLKTSAKFRHGTLKEIKNDVLLFEGFTIKIKDYDQIFILIDQISIMKILQKSAIFEQRVYFGDHYSKVIQSKKSYDTHFIKGGKVQIQRRVVQGETNNAEYLHTIPLNYSDQLEKLIKAFIDRNLFVIIKILLKSIHRKWLWLMVLSVVKPVKLSSLVDKQSLVTKLDRDICPSDGLLSMVRGKICASQSLANFVSISHQYGLDEQNLSKLIKFNEENPSITFNSCLYLKNLGPANLTLPMLQILEDDIKNVEC